MEIKKLNNNLTADLVIGIGAGAAFRLAMGTALGSEKKEKK